jgi:Peptidase family M41
VVDTREAIAYHEAGHAVVSMKLGYKCLYVTIIPDGSRRGHACCENPLIGRHDDKIEHALKVLLAARLAEGKHAGSPTWGDADDRVKATNLALLATDRDTERAEMLINEMIQETRKLVEQHWPEIDALAQRLLVNQRVNFLATSENPAPGYLLSGGLPSPPAHHQDCLKTPERCPPWASIYPQPDQSSGLPSILRAMRRPNFIIG